MLYGVLLVIGAAVAGWAISTIRPANIGVTRMTGAPYFVDANSVRNQFLVRLINKRSTPVSFSVEIESEVKVTQNGLTEPVLVAPLGEEVRPLILLVPRDHYEGPFKFKMEVKDTGGTFELKREVEFLGPDAELLKEDDAERKSHEKH
jgi:hypothetical protein